jgi:Ca2+-binding EF-hand superfamily protein
MGAGKSKLKPLGARASSSTSTTTVSELVLSNILTDDDMERLCAQSKFNSDELRHLHAAFKEHGASVSRETFNNVLRNLDVFGLKLVADTPLAYGLWKQLTQEADRVEEEDENDDNQVHFDEFVLGLSKVIKGSVEEKAAMTFLLFDKDKDGFVSRRELFDFYSDTYDALMARLKRQSAVDKYVGAELQTFQDELVASLRVRFERQLNVILNQLMAALDRDGDGRLTAREFAKFLQTGPVVVASLELHTDDADMPCSAADAAKHSSLQAQAPLSLLGAGGQIRQQASSSSRRRRQAKGQGQEAGESAASAAPSSSSSKGKTKKSPRRKPKKVK